MLTLIFEAACPKSLSVNVMPQSVIPPLIRNGDTVATVEAVVKTCPAQSGSPPASVTVTLTVTPPTQATEEAGGHAHNTARLKGTLRDQNGQPAAGCVVDSFDAQGMGTCKVTYHPSQVSGVETIIAEADGFPKAQAKVTVQVPNLIPMPESDIGAWRLTGVEPPHPGSHYGTLETLDRIRAMATDYFTLHGESIGVNDISLIWGGLFDIRGNWAPPHDGHRLGRSVDIDRCAQTLVKQDDLDRIARRSYSGIRVVEKAMAAPPCPGPPETPRIHYNFP